MHRMQSDSIANLATAIAAAQAELKPVKKDMTNPFYRSKYADLASVWEALQPYHAHGIAITQSPYLPERSGYIGLTTQLSHASGEWMAANLELPLSKDDAQGIGSALTYARRYALGCMTGVVTEEDDDGNMAAGVSHAPHAKTTQAVMHQSRVAKEKIAALMNEPIGEMDQERVFGKSLVPADTKQVETDGAAAVRDTALTQQGSDAPPPQRALLPSAVCQSFRLSESLPELSVHMNEWLPEASKHTQEDRMEVNRVFAEQKKRIMKGAK